MESFASAWEAMLVDGFPDGLASTGEPVSHADVGEGSLNAGVAVVPMVIYDDELGLRGFFWQVHRCQR